MPHYLWWCPEVLLENKCMHVCIRERISETERVEVGREREWLLNGLEITHSIGILRFSYYSCIELTLERLFGTGIIDLTLQNI